MREIKFRGKRIDNGQWVYGDIIHDIAEHNTPRICIDREYSTGTTFVANAPRVDYKTLGQYTGLKDKNGVEIYEGDIIECSSLYGEENICCLVEFCEYEDDEYTLHVKLNGTKKWLHSIYKYQYEVIGNIWDNPERLKIEVVKLTPYITLPSMELVKKVTREVFLKDR